MQGFNKIWSLLLLLAISYQGYSQSPSDIDRQRYLSILLLNLTADPLPSDIAMIKTAHRFGINSVYIAIPWDKIYSNSPTEAPRWQRFDEQIKTATDLGMKVALRIHLGRHITRIKGFWDIAESQRTSEGDPFIAGYGDTFYGFDNTALVDKGLLFVKEVITRYEYLQKENKLIFVSVTNSHTQEAEYPGSIYKNGKGISATFDYSATMLTGFRSWLAKHYKKIKRLNFLWGTSFASFETVHPPSTPWDAFETFRQKSGKDWYIYRHKIFKEYTDKTISLIKGINPNIKFITDQGSVFDAVSSVRGTMAYLDLNSKSDGIKVNDSEYSDHRWSVDILKSDTPAHFIIGNEAYINPNLDNNQFGKQIDGNFEHGVNFLALLIPTPEILQRTEPLIRSSSEKWLKTPINPIVYQDSVKYRLSEAVEKKGATNVIYQEWARKAYVNPNKSRPIRVKLDEDLLSENYWLEAANNVPYILRPIPMQIIAVNKEFSFIIPTDTFSDVDGTIVKYTVEGLPSWLRYENGQLKGKPTVLADYRITVHGFDDEGGTAEAYFTIRVDTRENANKPPTVNSNFSNLTIALDKLFDLKIPADAFQDKDGHITKVEASELPAWLSFSNGKFAGTPKVLGEYRIFLKAYDDLNAFVETYFTIRVVEPHLLNISPFATSSIPIKYLPLNQAFTYNIPNIFGDADGYISSITVLNRPSWLNFSFNTFSGTPTVEGQYRLIIRAYDNGGAFIDVPFLMIVEIPKLRFELVRGGRAIDQQIIGPLESGDIFPFDSLPERLNIFASGNFDFDKITFHLSGPLSRSSSTTTFPFAFYESEGGLIPYVGTYTLNAIASNKDSVVVSNSIEFSISYGDYQNITKNIAEWNFYPNPTDGMVSIKLPELNATTPSELTFQLIPVSGQTIAIPTTAINYINGMALIDFKALNTPAGSVVIKVFAKGAFIRQFRIFKK